MRKGLGDCPYSFRYVDPGVNEAADAATDSGSLREPMSPSRAPSRGAEEKIDAGASRIDRRGTCPLGLGIGKAPSKIAVEARQTAKWAVDEVKYVPSPRRSRRARDDLRFMKQ